MNVHYGIILETSSDKALGIIKDTKSGVEYYSNSAIGKNSKTAFYTHDLTKGFKRAIPVSFENACYDYNSAIAALKKDSECQFSKNLLNKSVSILNIYTANKVDISRSLDNPTIKKAYVHYKETQS